MKTRAENARPDMVTSWQHSELVYSQILDVLKFRRIAERPGLLRLREVIMETSFVKELLKWKIPLFIIKKALNINRLSTFFPVLESHAKSYE